MEKYLVDVTRSFTNTFLVEADSESEAIDIAKLSVDKCIYKLDTSRIDREKDSYYIKQCSVDNYKGHIFKTIHIEDCALIKLLDSLYHLEKIDCLLCNKEFVDTLSDDDKERLNEKSDKFEEMLYLFNAIIKSSISSNRRIDIERIVQDFYRDDDDETDDEANCLDF